MGRTTTLTNHRAPRAGLVILAATALCLHASRVFAQTDVARDQVDESLVAPSTPDEIRRLIEQLGDASYEQRVRATRRLCAVGAPARDALEAAARSDDPERSLRARKILSRLGELWFAGVDVRLSLSSETIAWDEPVELRVTFRNASAFPARLPLDLGQLSGAGGSRPDVPGLPIDDATQVGWMVDLADVLTVRDTRGQEIELRVDAIEDDAAVEEAVRRRAEGTANAHTLQAGEEVTIRVPAFNRGWARFPLLDAETYSIVFAYAPKWDDQALVRARVGRVSSNEISLRVSRAAPDAISRTGLRASVSVRHEGPELVALLINHADRSVYANLNLGEGLPFAAGAWLLQTGGQERELPVQPAAGRTWHDFSFARIAKIAPGAAVELARIELAALKQRADDPGAEAADAEWHLSFRYANLCDRRWQRRQDGPPADGPEPPPILVDPLPPHLLTGRFISQPAPITK